MQQIAPRTEQGRQQQQQQQPQQQQQHHLSLQRPIQPQQQHQHQFQPSQTLAQSQIHSQAQAQAPSLGQASATDQGHASSDRSTAARVLRDHMATPPTSQYTPADVMHHAATSSPTEPHHSEQMGMQDSVMGETSPDGRKGYGKRELSTSKRAAQNRAAQRAFRQRKEGYIKKLEEQVREYGVLSENYKAVQQENFQLRDYIIALQSQLLEAQREVPPPPGGLDGLQPGAKQGLGPQQGPSQLPGTATLPRLSELGAVQSQPPQPIQPQVYDNKMTSAQAALQGPSILHSPNTPR